MVVLLAGGVWSAGCGSDDSDGDSNPSGDAGAAGEAGSAGADNEAGTEAGNEEAGSDGGDGGAAGDSGADAQNDVTTEAASPLVCGGDTCGGTSIADAIELAACCATTQGGAEGCGLDVSQLAMLGLNPPEPCVEKNQPGALDSDCPDYCVPVSMGDVLNTTVTLKGCKNTALDKCGIMADSLSLDVPIIGSVTAEFGLGCAMPEQFGVASGTSLCDVGDGGTTDNDSGTTDDDSGTTDDDSGATDDDGGATDDDGGATDDDSGATDDDGGATNDDGGATNDDGGTTDDDGGATDDDSGT